MRRLRAGLMGSIRAWLPSRRSTAHHSGALVIRGPARCGRAARRARPARGTACSGGRASARCAGRSRRAGPRGSGRRGCVRGWRREREDSRLVLQWVCRIRTRPAHAPPPRRGAGRSDPAAAAKEQSHHGPEGSPHPGARASRERRASHPTGSRSGTMAPAGRRYREVTGGGSDGPGRRHGGPGAADDRLHHRRGAGAAHRADPAAGQPGQRRRGADRAAGRDVRPGAVEPVPGRPTRCSPCCSTTAPPRWPGC